MDFFKKLFGKKEDADGAFTCEKCGEERKESERKETSGEDKGGTSSNVCEFC